MIRIYIKDNCPHCKGIIIPEGVNAVKIDINGDYGGYIPPQVPCMQLNGITLAGPPSINGFLISIKKAQDGEYKI